MSKLSRTFGLEFEHISKADHRSLAAELTNAGVTIDPYATGVSHCREGCYSGWQVKTDGSISPAGNYEYGIELVSPPLTLKQSKQIRTALKVARKYGAINSSCGMHVHVAAPEFGRLHHDYDVQAKVSAIWLGIEKILFTYMPPSRRMSDYCRGGVHWNVKYQAFNTSPIENARKRTIEFRLHNATLNPDKAIAFAALCIGIVDKMAEQLRANEPESPIILPTHTEDVPPKEIKTQRGGRFYLLRNSGKWIIESKKLTTQVDSLAVAYKEFQKALLLTGDSYLKAFHYPHFGNAMSKLCDYLQVNGAFRGYAEDRYERMLKKHGPADSIATAESVMDDEEDYYNEPDYETDEAA